MRLKSILEENNKSSLFDKIDHLIDSGDFVFETPHIFRGTDRAGTPKVSVKDVSGRKNRLPVDAGKHVDAIIEGFYQHCYPDFPTRRESAFATVDYNDAAHFGKVYVVLPHVEANLSSNEIEPYDYFNGMEDHIEKLWSLFESSSDELSEWFITKFGSHYKEPLLLIAGYLSGKDRRGWDPNQMKCISDLVSYLYDFKDKFANELANNTALDKLVYHTLHIAYKIDQYFSGLERGYPSSKIQGAEVMIDGKYLQIEYELFQQYLESRREQ